MIFGQTKKNGADKFKGELIHFGTEKFPNWKSICSYLVDKKQNCLVFRFQIKEDMAPMAGLRRVARKTIEVHQWNLENYLYYHLVYIAEFSPWLQEAFQEESVIYAVRSEVFAPARSA